MFVLLPWERAEEYQQLLLDLKIEYGPKSRTELILVERMAQHQKSEIGFESQKRQKEQHDMKKDHHKWSLALAEARLYYQQTLTDRQKHLMDEENLKLIAKS